jgi:putative membrane protein
MDLKRSEWAVLIFTLGYVTAFGVYFVAAGNSEFVWYVVTLIILMGLVGATRRQAGFTPGLLWMLSIWGLAHMSGGSIRVDGAVLYAWYFLPLYSSGDLQLLKYDQIVHFYGFAVTAVVLWQILRHNFPSLEGTRTLLVFPVLGSMGLGSLNELIEFAAVLSFENTNVGGYTNTALDLLFNTLGAIFAMTVVGWRRARRAPS